MPSSGRAIMTMIQASLDAGSRWGRVSTRKRNANSARTSRTSAQDERWIDKSASAQAHEVERASSEETGSLPQVAQRVGAGGAAVLAHLDVPGVDPHPNGEHPVLGLLVVAGQRRLDIARNQFAITSDRN